MKHLFIRLNFLKSVKETFSNKHGVVTNENRSWEDAYRKRWQHDKIVRSTGNNKFLYRQKRGSAF